MANKKIQIIPPGYTDVLHPESVDSQILITDAGAHFASTKLDGVLDELFTSVSNGKTEVATAITGKGVTASGSDTFTQLATKVGQIETGVLSPLDWSAYTTNYNWTGTTTSVPATSYGTFLDVTGEGFLLFARGDATSVISNPNIRITVDGVSYVFDGVNVGLNNQGNVLVHPIYYKSSLKIEVFNRTASSTPMRCDYTYLSKISNPSKNQTLLTSTSRKMAYAKNATTADTDVVNITGSGYLLAIEFTGFYASAGANFTGTVTVDSIIKMNTRSVFHSVSESVKQHAFIGPIRFETNLRVQHKVNVVGSTAITKVFYVLD